MIRFTCFALLTSAIGATSGAGAELPVAPAPREVRPDGTRDPAPEAETPRKEDPREIVERIIKNSNDVGDKLAMTDTGTDTQKTQEQILQDIDRLLNQDDPPPKPDQNQQKDKNQDQKDKKDKQQDKSQQDQKDKKDMKGGGMGDQPPRQKDGGEMQPTGGDQPKERRPRGGDKQQKQEPQKPDKKPGGGGAGGKQQKQDMKAGKPKEPMTGGVKPDPKGDSIPPPSDPLLPVENDVQKDVWGHLPEKLRQEATEYYKQEILPRYAKLLEHYYSTMSKKN